jgi:hypothetical protein
MTNQIAHKMTMEAETHFNEIDTSHSGGLNLVDILKYERKGAQERNVGQFLEHNFAEIHGVSERDLGLSHQSNISMNDLKFVDLLSGDQAFIDQQKGKDIAQAKFDGAILALSVAASPSLLMASHARGIAAVAAFLGFEATAAYGGAKWRQQLVADHYLLQQDIVSKMQM